MYRTLPISEPSNTIDCPQQRDWYGLRYSVNNEQSLLYFTATQTVRVQSVSPRLCAMNCLATVAIRQSSQ
jgi:hypothetical protein